MTRALLLCIVACCLAFPHDCKGEIVDSLALAARLLADQGRYDEADEAYRDALALDWLSANDRYALKINWCEVFLRRGMYQTANDTLDAIPGGQASVRWRMRKAETLTYLGKYAEAREIYDGLLEGYLSRRRKGWVNADDVKALYNRGYLNALTGLRDSAVSDMRAAIEAETDERSRNIMISNLALQEAKSGRYDEAASDIESSLAYFRSTGGTDHPEYVITLRKKAEILLMRGEREEATDIFVDYAERERERAVREFALFTEQARLDYWKNKRLLISEIFQTEDERPEALLDVSVFRREVSLLGGADSADIPQRLALRGNDVRAALKADEVAVDFIKYYNDTEGKYAALVAYPLNDPRGVRFVALWTERELNDYRVGYTTLKSAVCSRLGSDKSEVYSDSVLAEMIWSPLRRHIGDAAHVYFCPDGLLNMLAVEYLPQKEAGPLLHRLTSFSRLVARGQEEGHGTQRMLAVGGLDYNEDVCDDGTGNHDAVDLLHQKVGHGSIFSYLRGTKEEVAAIDSCLKERLPIDTAYVMTESELKRELDGEKYSAVHLSTHGYSLSVDVSGPTEMTCDSLTEDRSLIASGIALSGANVAYLNAGGEDEVLSARELCDMNLKHIDMIVLSACQTGLGVVSDEGPAGIVRGLKKSGANTILASLWEVDDQATRLLMTAYYQNMAASPDMTKAEALALAQGSLKSYKVVARSVFNPATLSSAVEYVEYTGEGEPITPYSDPYYWAPFIVIDDRIRN